MDLPVRVGSDTNHVIVVYRPPPSTKNKSTTGTFFSEIGTKCAAISPGRLHILADFHFHIENDADRNLIKFNELLSSLDFTGV